MAQSPAVCGVPPDLYWGSAVEASSPARATPPSHGQGTPVRRQQLAAARSEVRARPLREEVLARLADRRVRAGVRAPARSPAVARGREREPEDAGRRRSGGAGSLEEDRGPGG